MLKVYVCQKLVLAIVVFFLRLRELAPSGAWKCGPGSLSAEQTQIHMSDGYSLEELVFASNLICT